jgi:hypothetical protein
MRTTTAVRLGAAFTASALALSLGAGTALAEDSTDTQSVHLKSVSPTAGTAARTPVSKSQATKTPFSGTNRSSVTPSVANCELPPTSDITSFSQKSIVLGAPGTFVFEGAPIVTNPAGVGYIGARVTVGSAMNSRELYFEGADPAYPYFGIVLPSTSPVGKAKLGPSNIYYQCPDHTSTGTTTHDDTVGGTFYIRRLTKSIATYGFEIYRSDSKIKFKANSWKIFQPSTGKLVGIRSIKLQYRHTNGSYSTYKTIPLNIYGTGSWSTTTNTKRHYRLKIYTTDTIWGSWSETSPLI